jgi:NitT/TauT family transport system substrate-binding protein
MKTIKLYALALAGAVIAALAAPGARAEPLKIRIQTNVPPAHITPLMPAAAKFGIYKYWGKSYVVEPVTIAGSGPGMTALAAGEIELAAQGAQTLALTVTNAKLDVRAIASEIASGVPGYAATGFWVRKGEINTIDEMHHKVLGVNARGSTPDSVYRLMLGKKGWKEGEDYQIAEVRFAAQLSALESKRIDVAFLVQPFALLAERAGKFHMLFDSADVLGPTETLVYVGKADWIAQNRAALIDFMEDHMRMRRWMTSKDPKTRAEVLGVLSEELHQPVANFADWAFTEKGGQYSDPLLRIDVARLQKNIDDIKAAGILKETIDAKKYVDMSLADEAAKRFKSQ